MSKHMYTLLLRYCGLFTSLQKVLSELTYTIYSINFSVVFPSGLVTKETPPPLPEMLAPCLDISILG